MTQKPAGHPVGNLHGEVYCKTTKKRVYGDSAHGGASLESQIKTMPPKKKCKSFYATATIAYLESVKKFTDRWQWKWDDCPA